MVSYRSTEKRRKDRMNEKARIAVWLSCIAAVACMVFPQGAVAQYRDARSCSQVHATVIRLADRLSEARHVEDATRKYSSTYGAAVGRWVWLARDVGWPWSQMGTLMFVVHRESRGDPEAANPYSSASGLLQFLSFWYAGDNAYGWSFNPESPRQSLAYGLKLWRRSGWSPWGF